MSTRKNYVPFQFELPESLHRKGKEKSDENGVAIAPFMRMAYEQFVELPIAESMALLKQHNNRKKKRSKKTK